MTFVPTPHFPTSPLDVLDGFFGGGPTLEAVALLTLDQVDELGAMVVQSAEALSSERVEASDAGELVYPGGWLARGWGQTLFRSELNCALLYEPRVLVHDPLAEYFFAEFDSLPRMRSIKAHGGMSLSSGPSAWANHGRRVHREGDLDAIRADLTRIVRFMLDVEPLIRGGVIVMRSQWPTIRRRQRQLMASCIADMSSVEMQDAAWGASAQGGLLPRWDNPRGGQVTVSTGFLDPQDPAQRQPEFFYLAKTLAVADAAGATYAPSTRDELSLLMAKSVTLASGRHAAPSQPVLQEVLSLLIPDLDLSPAAAVKIRTSEDSFEAWRRSLRDIQRQAAGVEPAALQELVEDRLRPEVEAVTKVVNRSPALREHARSGLAAAILTAGTNMVTGVPLAANAAASGVTGVAGWLWNAYAPRRVDGSRAVVAALLRTHN